MGFLDSLRDRFAGRDDDYYDDDEYYDGDYDDGGDDLDEPPARTGLLGNSRRPEPESVAVYTRSGQHVGSQGSFAGAAYDHDDDYGRAPAPVGGYTPREPVATPDVEAAGTRVIPRVTSSRLPPYVMRPASYDDAQTVVRRVQTNQPVVLILHSTNLDAAKRILDFCYGLTVGMGGAMQELGDRVFAVLPPGVELSQSDIDKLVADGDLAR